MVYIVYHTILSDSQVLQKKKVLRKILFLNLLYDFTKVKKKNFNGDLFQGKSPLPCSTMIIFRWGTSCNFLYTKLMYRKFYIYGRTQFEGESMKKNPSLSKMMLKKNIFFFYRYCPFYIFFLKV